MKTKFIEFLWQRAKHAFQQGVEFLLQRVKSSNYALSPIAVDTFHRISIKKRDADLLNSSYITMVKCFVGGCSISCISRKISPISDVPTQTSVVLIKLHTKKENNRDKIKTTTKLRLLVKRVTELVFPSAYFPKKEKKKQSVLFGYWVLCHNIHQKTSS